MATENNTIETKVTLDATQAQQEIVKLNAIASDGTKTLEQRVAAKNQQLALTEKLNKQEIANLEKIVKNLTGVVGAETQLDAAQKKLNSTRVKTLKQETALIKQGNGLSKSLAGSKGAVNNLNNATGGLITSFTTLAANPIILAITVLVGLVKLLKEAFTSSEEGQNKWNKLMDVGSALIGNMLDLVADLTEGLIWMFTNPREALEKMGQMIKDNIETRLTGIMELLPKLGNAISLVFEGKFREAGKVAVDAMGKVVLGVDSVTASVNLAGEALSTFIKEQEREAKAAASVSDMRAKADKIERQLIVDRSIQEAKIADLRLKAKQEEQFTATERKAFLSEALKLGDELLTQETEYLTLRRDAQILENTFSRSNKENLTAEAEAIADVNRKQTERLNLARTIETENKRVNGQIAREEDKKQKAREAARKADMKQIEDNKKILDKTLEDDKEAEAKRLVKLEEDKEKARQLELSNAEKDRNAQNEIDALEIERAFEAGENTLQMELDFLIRKRDQELAQENLTAKEKELIRLKYSDAIESIQKDELAMSKAMDAQMLNSTIALAGEAFGVSKELAIAQALIKAPEAISSVWTQAAKKPTLPQVLLHGIGGTAMVVAPIIKGLASIKQTKMKGKAGSKGGGSGGGSISAGGGATGISSTEVSDLSANNAANLGANSNLNNAATAAAAANVSGGSSGNVVFSESAYNDFSNQISFIEGQTTVG